MGVSRGGGRGGRGALGKVVRWGGSVFSFGGQNHGKKKFSGGGGEKKKLSGTGKTKKTEFRWKLPEKPLSEKKQEAEK